MQVARAAAMECADRSAAMGFDPLRTRLVFLGQLSDQAREGFCAGVRAALEEVPPPAPRDDATLQRLHRIWSAARRQAFERVVAALDE